MTQALASVIVCTLAKERRGPLLRRALDSILSGQDGLAQPIVVVNGSSFDRGLRAELAARSDLRFLYRPEPNLAGALLAGRRAVDTRFFATLDDDDELLPGAIATRLEPLLADDATDVVVTNGYLDDGQRQWLQYQEFARIARDPLRGILPGGNCWLQSVNAMYRSDRVTTAAFEGMPDYFEWTWLALRLAPSHKIRFLDRPTYRINRHEPDSLSLSLEFNFGAPRALRAMLALDLPRDVRRELRQRLSAGLHNVSVQALRFGDYRLAWRSHLASLGVGPSWRWLLYTRRLLLPSAEPGAHDAPASEPQGGPAR